MSFSRCLLLAASTALAAPAALAATAPYAHVLLISVDGMHGIDLQNFIDNPAHANSTLTQLAARGTVYQAAYTTAPSDSFPGMIAQVTGATPLTADIFYDDSFDRTAFAPGSNCVGAAGVETNLAEPLDKDSSRLDGGGVLGNVYSQLNKAALPLLLKNGHCKPAYPHEFIKANTIFEVIKAAGMRTAWSDKHPAYEILMGPSGKGIDDLFTPEVNSNNILGGSGDNTSSFAAIQTYDTVKVNAVINQIDGFNSLGDTYEGVPAVFGMNFQAVSIGQKLAYSKNAVDAGLTGGYLDSSATPGNALSGELAFVDASLGKMVQELKNQNLYNNTLIIISAKHGQSPIDITQRTTRDDGVYFPPAPNYAFEIADDELLFWVTPGTNAAGRAATLSYLQGVAAASNLQAVYDATTLGGIYKSPLTDARTPDFIGVAAHGTIYTTGSKLAEHGGFSDDDRHVAMLVSGSGVTHTAAVTAPVATTQIAPTILQALGLNPNKLEGVRKEGTQVLPAVFH